MAASTIEHGNEPARAVVAFDALRLLAHVRGLLLFRLLKLRHRRLVRDARPLALHLENEVFPALRNRGEKWLELDVVQDGGILTLQAVSGAGRRTFPLTEYIAQALGTRGVRKLRLDTALECGQVVESLLILLYAAPALADGQPYDAEYRGWNRRLLAGQMLGPGTHKVCANLRFDRDTGAFSVEYSYCELFFSRLIRNYIERRRQFRDHRALFRAGPRAALAVLLLFAAAEALVYWHASLSVALYMTTALVTSGIVWLSLHTIGSYQYTREHHEALIKGYYEQAMVLARFPQTNPSLELKLGPEGTLLYLNPAVRRLLDAAALDEAQIHRILPDDYRDLVRHCLTEDVAQHEAEVTCFGHTLRYIFSPFPDENAVIVAGTDITRLKQIEHELRMLNQHLEDLVEERTHELQETQDVTILSLAGLAELRDQETGQHLQRTRLYVRTLAETLRRNPRYAPHLSDAMIEKLYKSAPLHDIGKVGVPDAILLKPGQLTPEETTAMRRHTAHGGDALQWAEQRLGFDSFLSVAREIAYCHHEKWDGTGYPRGLKGEEIPLCARLMSIADVYDALTTKRVYKEAYSHERAKGIIQEWKGAYFDPAVVDAFLECEADFLRIAEKYRDTDQAA